MLSQLSTDERRIAKIGSLVGDELAQKFESSSERALSVLRSLFVPHLTDYERQEARTIVLDFLTLPLFPLLLCKIAQQLLAVHNFFLIYVIASIPPFLFAVRSVFAFIPCPRIAGLVSNAALLAVLIVLVIFAQSTYRNAWQTFVYCQTVWVWLVVASMIARLHIGRGEELARLSPLFHLPLLGFIGAGSQICMLKGLRTTTLTDCAVLISLDATFSALFRWNWINQIRAQGILITLIGIYFGSGLNAGHAVFILGRMLSVARSIGLKKFFGKPGIPDLEISSIFNPKSPPKLHAFSGHPAPILSRLESVFFSGLVDGDAHALGPKGTVDLATLTDFIYSLPLFSLASWLLESETLPLGLNPEIATPRSAWLIYPIVFLVALHMFAVPWATARRLFHRGSCPAQWPSRPIFLTGFLVAVDWLYVNYGISRIKQVFGIATLVTFSLVRSSLLTRSKQKQTILGIQSLCYFQPSAARSVQKAALKETMEACSPEELRDFLLQTAVRHGSNVREVVKSAGQAVWDPAPAATAAWKLAGSLVIRALRARREGRAAAIGKQNIARETVLGIVDELIRSSVGLAEGEEVKIADRFWRKRALKVGLRNFLVHIQRKKSKGRFSKAKMGQLMSGGVRALQESVDADPIEIPGVVKSPGGSPTVPRKSIFSTSTSQPLPSSLSVLVSFGSGKIGIQVIETLRGSDTVDIASGGGTNFALDGNLVYAWGSNAYLQLGMRLDISAVPTPSLVKPLRESSITAIACSPAELGQAHALALTSSGGVIAFGSSGQGALGLNDVQRTEPRPLRLSVRMTSIACGLRHSAMIDENGRVWVFGDNAKGQLGIGARVSYDPIRLDSLPPVRLIACGDSHTLAVSQDDFLFSWGENSCGQLGLGNFRSSQSPTQLDMKGLKAWKSIACGSSHSLAITSNRCFAWGSDASAQLGLGQAKPDEAGVNLPRPMAGLTGRILVKVVAAGEHTLILDDSGQVHVCGDNRFGQLGLAAPGSDKKARGNFQHPQDGQEIIIGPTVVPGLTLYRVLQIATSDKHSLCLGLSN